MTHHILQPIAQARRLLQRGLHGLHGLRSRVRSAPICAAACALAALLGAAAPARALEGLPALGADPAQHSVSGLSSGAFMAVQLQVAYSKTFIGSGVVAGGPYYCAAGNVAFAGICMGQVPFLPPNPAIMAGFARSFAQARKIDPLRTLATRRVYVFSGTEDSVVRSQAVEATVAFFEQVGVPADRIQFVSDVPAGHAVITPAEGNACDANKSPYISHCSVGGQGYDQAGALLAHIYGPLQPPAAQPGGQLVEFDQQPFGAKAAAMAPTGWLYVPTACTGPEARCRVHVALHGCLQSTESVGQRFLTETGYNAWADTNRLLVLYPQVNKSRLAPYNPNGCWDWWGYTRSTYAQRSAPQMKAIVAMVRRLAQAPSTR